MLRELLGLYRADLRRIAVVTALGTLTALAEVGALLALAPMFQAVAEGSSRYVGDAGPISVDIAVTTLAAISAALALISFLLQLAQAALSGRLAANATYRKRRALMTAYEKASWPVAAAETESHLVVLSAGHSVQYGQGISQLSSVARAAISIVVFVAGSFVVSIASTMAIVVAMSVVFVLMRPILRATRRVEQATATAILATANQANEIAQSARETAAFGVGRYVSDRYVALADTERRLKQRSMFLGAIAGPTYRVAGLVLLIGLVTIVAGGDGLEVAAIGIIVLFLYRSLSYGQGLVTSYQKLATMPPYLRELDRTIDRLSRSPQPHGNCSLDEVCTITVDNVSYTYTGEPTPALSEVSLCFGRGDIIGLIGPSGAGKSTLAELLLALREPTEGSIRFDETPIEELSQHSRARLTALVSQAVPVVRGTVRDNVAFHRDLPAADIDDALARVGLASFVDSLESKGDTLIGTGNRAVSGGQRQRLGIARAIVGRPSLIVLDEPTSALDAVSEDTIIDLIGELKDDAAVVVIAHRLSTLKHCTRVLVIEDGGISGSGSLGELQHDNAFVARALATGVIDDT